MLRFFTFLVVFGWASASLCQAADPITPKGNWRFQFQATEAVNVLVTFTEQDGAWKADIADVFPPIAGPNMQPLKLSIKSFKFKGDAVDFAVAANASEILTFQGILAKDGKKINGSIKDIGGKLAVIELLPTKLKKLSDDVELIREEFATLENGPYLFSAGLAILGKAAEKKIPIEEARSIVDRLTKSASVYGTRWEQNIALKLANTLSAQAGFAELGLAQAQRTERMAGDDAGTSVQIEIQQAIVLALTKAGKADEAKKVQQTILKLEARDATEFAKLLVPYETPAYGGRKAKSDRVALVELFTGSEEESCFAPTSAVEGVLKSYKPSEAVVLEYHVPAGAPDPLMNKDGLNRQFLMFKQIAAPLVLVNGKPLSRTGAGTGEAKERYKQLTDLVNEQLELPPGAKLAVTIEKDAKGLKATAKVSDLDKPGDKVTLRFVVIEPTVRYDGASGVRFHSNVVRALPGGPKGFPLPKKDAEQSVVVNTDDIRNELLKFFDEIAKEQEFAKPDRPLALKNLKLVVFIQNDETRDVLQAVQLDLEAK